jgi:hypothetical protein
VAARATETAKAEPAGPSQQIAPANSRSHGWLRGALRHVLVVLFVAIWIGAVVYPDPRPLVSSLERLRDPPVDAAAVAPIAATLPDDYQSVEDFSLGYVDYRSAWTVYGLPWYFPTVKEVLNDRAGDCQARALLAASIFEAKDMPYTLRYSFDHVWVDYPGKLAPDMEDPDTAFVADDGQGWMPNLPKRLPLWTILKVRVAYHWSPMPLLQKILVVLGSLFIIGWGERRALRRLSSWPPRLRFSAAFQSSTSRNTRRRLS